MDPVPVGMYLHLNVMCHVSAGMQFAGFMMIIKAMRRAEALEQQLQLLGTERLTVADEKEDA